MDVEYKDERVMEPRLCEFSMNGACAENETKYPAKLHARRVARQLRQAGDDDENDGLVYLAGQPEMNIEDSDMPLLFRQRKYFFYLCGADLPDCHVTYDLAADRLILWIPRVAPRDALYYGSAPSPERCMKLYDVDEVRHSCGLARFVEDWRGGGKDSCAPVYVLHEDQLPPASTSSSSSSSSLSSCSRPTSMSKCRFDSTRLLPAMDRARVTKTPYEINMIRTANSVTAAAHRAVAERLLRMRSERDVEAVFQSVCTTRGTRVQAYGIIAGAGAHAATLHYGANDGPLRLAYTHPHYPEQPAAEDDELSRKKEQQDSDSDRLLLLDAGCEWRGYASDVTRTMPVAGRFSPRAAAVHALVQRMQHECVSRVRPGVRYLDLHLCAAAVGLAGLLRLGLLRGDAAEIERAGTVAAFFPHGLGHHVGLEVHDVDGGEPLLRAASSSSSSSPSPSSLSSPTSASAEAGSVSSRLAVRPRMMGKRTLITPDDLVAMTQEARPLNTDDATSTATSKRGLQPNMVVTIEPGIYFSRPYLEVVFRPDPKHARFIDWDLLEAYYPIGGVRIEDDILVTADGYENLTTAPKGAELLEIINRGQSGVEV